MNWALWHKAIREAVPTWLACAALLFAFGWVQVWITSQVDMTQFRGILDNVPEAWQRLSPVPIQQLISYPTRIAITYEEPLVYLAIAVWAISRSSDSVSGEIGRGTMEMLLAQPASRLRVILTPTAVTAVGTALLAVAAWGGTRAGIATVTVQTQSDMGWTVPLLGIDVPLGGAAAQPKRISMRELVDPHLLWPATLNVFALGFFLTGIGTLLSSWDRYRGRTIGIMVAIYVVQMLMELISLAVPGWQWMKWCTFFSAYEPIAITSRTLMDSAYAWSWVQRDAQAHWVAAGPLSYDAVLFGLGVISMVLASIVFVRRDIPAPL